MSYKSRARKRAIKRNTKKNQSADRQLDAFYRKRQAARMHSAKPRSHRLIGKCS